MHRIINFGFVLLLVCGCVFGATNPVDIEFQARLAKDRHVYHIGEPVEIEISYSTQTEKKYFGSFHGASPELETLTPRVSPREGITDLRELRQNQGGSFLGSLGYLGSQPFTQQLDLCEWYRFRKPGSYSVTVRSTEISRVKGAEEGGGQEHLTLETNPLEFVILPRDADWEAAQLRDVESNLKAATNAGERMVALHRLVVMDTISSVRVLVHQYLTGADGGEGWVFERGLRESAHADIIISSLLAALTDPAANIPTNLPQLLADLQTREELGAAPPAYPNGAANYQKWNKEVEARNKVHDKFLAQANTLLMESIDRRSRPERAKAVYQVWYDATLLNAQRATPDILSRLQNDVLDAANELDSERKTQFVVLGWQTMPHEQLHPLIRQLAQDSVKQPRGYANLDAFRFWCEGWREECNEAILQDVIETDAGIDKNVILMMSEAERPKLDKMLEAQLQDPARLYDGFQSQRTGAVVLRAGSRNLVPAVESFLDRSDGQPRCDGETQGDLLGYLFRVAPENGTRRLSAKLQDKNDFCGNQLLRALHNVRPSDEIIPVAIKALNSPNLSVAQTAALYLENHGPPSSQNSLWQRLEELWDAWRDRSSELPEVAMIASGSETSAQTAALERALASSLAHATNWKLTPEELHQLRTGCLTQSCRDIADGKLSLGL